VGLLKPRRAHFDVEADAAVGQRGREPLFKSTRAVFVLERRAICFLYPRRRNDA
jgi:hypothetical protein